MSNKPYALITAYQSGGAGVDNCAMSDGFEIIFGNPTVPAFGAPHVLCPFTLADDDGYVYCHGYIYEGEYDDGRDPWLATADWGAYNYGTTVLAHHHQLTELDEFGDAVGTDRIYDQVVS